MRVARAAVMVLFLVAAAGPHATRADERLPLVTLSTSDAHAVEGGQWFSLVQRSAPWACGRDKDSARCVEQGLAIDNQSPRALECHAHLVYRGSRGLQASDLVVPALVTPRSKRVIHAQITQEAASVELASLECRDRAPYQRLEIPEGCRYSMSGKPLRAYYPDDATGRSLEGPVSLSFLLPGKDGAATQIAVVESSLVPSLDAAARQFLSDQTFTTTCPGTRFDVRVRFTLRN